MTIQEAVKSGRPFKRPKDDGWFVRLDLSQYYFTRNDLEATDWIAHSQEIVEITRSSAIEAISLGDGDYYKTLEALGFTKLEEVSNRVRP
jgi:hypothetical protein